MGGTFDEQTVFAALSDLQRNFDRLAEFLREQLSPAEIDFAGDVDPVRHGIRRLAESLGYDWKGIQADADRMRLKERGPAKRYAVLIDGGEGFDIGEEELRFLTGSVFTAGTRFCRIRDADGRELLVNLGRIITAREAD